jgi:hypothetical protein
MRRVFFILGLLIVGLAFVSPLRAGETAEPGSLEWAVKMWRAFHQGHCATFNRMMDQYIATGAPRALQRKGALYETGNCVPLDYTKAAHFYRRAALHNFDAALYYLANFHLQGRGVARDVKAAELLFKRALLRLVGVPAGKRLAYVRSVMAYRGLPLEVVDFLAWLGKLERGGSKAKLAVGRRLLAGDRGLVADRLGAFLWLGRAANEGSAEAAALLASTFPKGSPPDPDASSRNQKPIRGYEWLSAHAEAFERGDCVTANRLIDAQIEAGDIWVLESKGENYELGSCLAQDFVKAAEAYRRADKMGGPRAIFLLADLYRLGPPGLPKDVEKARRLFRLGVLRLIGRRHGERLVWLDEILHRQGLSDLSRQALNWVRDLDPGDGPGRLAIARKLREGTGGLPRDARAARSWLEAAAKAGSAEAKRELAK